MMYNFWAPISPDAVAIFLMPKELHNNMVLGYVQPPSCDYSNETIYIKQIAYLDIIHDENLSRSRHRRRGWNGV